MSDCVFQTQGGNIRFTSDPFPEPGKLITANKRQDGIRPVFLDYPTSLQMLPQLGKPLILAVSDFSKQSANFTLRSDFDHIHLLLRWTDCHKVWAAPSPTDVEVRRNERLSISRQAVHYGFFVDVHRIHLA